MIRFFASIIAAVTFITPVSAAMSPGSDNPNLLPFTVLTGNVVHFNPGEFTPATAQKIRPTMLTIAALKPRGLILDLRNIQGSEVGTVHALMESLLPRRTPYMRFYSSNVKRLAVTDQPPVFKKSTPVVVVRNQKTVNEPDIVIYALQKIRKAGVLEFSPGRAALKRIYKQNVRMDDYRPIKESVFFVVPDVRLIGDEGASESDVIPRAASFIKELSPWDDARTTTAR